MDVIPLIFVLILRTSLNHSDAEGLASLYSEDAKILSPNRDFIEGMNAIQTFWQGALEMGIKSFKSERNYNHDPSQG